jgi:hypothetical protein
VTELAAVEEGRARVLGENDRATARARATRLRLLDRLASPDAGQAPGPPGAGG